MDYGFIRGIHGRNGIVHIGASNLKKRTEALTELSGEEGDPHKRRLSPRWARPHQNVYS